MCVSVYIHMCSIVSVHVESEDQYKLSLLLTPFFLTQCLIEPKWQAILARLAKSQDPSRAFS